MKSNRKFIQIIIIFTFVCILLKLLASVLHPISTYLLLLSLGIFMVYVLLSCIKNYKRFISGRYFISTLIFIGTLWFSFLPIFKHTELARFYLLKNSYEKIAKEVGINVMNVKNTTYSEYEQIFPNQLTTLNNYNLLYIKNNSELVIGFMASLDFFHRRDFVYFSSEEAHELIERDNMYDSIEWMEYPTWAYIKWY